MGLIGKQVEQFSADAFQKAKGFIKVTDADFKGKWSVLCFYPADFTFVCPTELADLQDYYGLLKDMGAEVYSVSTDTHFTHKAWVEHSPAVSKVEYIMIGDPNHQLSKMFNVLGEESGLADRGTFIIDPDGKIQMAEISAGGVGRDASIISGKIKTLKFARENPTEVCPAKWTEGTATLKPSLDLVGKL